MLLFALRPLQHREECAPRRRLLLFGLLHAARRLPEFRLNAYPYGPLLETELAEALAEVEAALRGKCTEYRQLDLFEEQPAAAAISLVSTRPEA